MEKGTVINILDKGYVKLIDSMGDDLTPLRAARMSTGNETGVSETKDDGLRDYLWRHQHTSPFEFCDLILEIQCPIFIAREWMRHRTFSYNEFSQRYSEALDIYYVPEIERMALQSNVNNQGSGEKMPAHIADAISQEMEAEQIKQRSQYDAYIDSGLSRELARINMPVSNYTKFQVKGNLKNWMHFIKLRIAEGAQYEIRVYAQAILDICRAIWPKLTDVFEEHTLEAVTFSRTEMELLTQMLAEYEVEKSTFLGTLDMRKLPASRQREFFAKLGLNDSE